MAFPSEIKEGLISGVVGEISHFGPLRAIPVVLDSDNAANNVMGRAFTYKDKATETVRAGGTTLFAGILINPKTHPMYGTAENPFDISAVLPNGKAVELMQMGYVYVELTNTSAVEIGSAVAYSQTTGELTAVADPSAPGDGLTTIPNCVVDRHNSSAEMPTLAVIKLTN